MPILEKESLDWRDVVNSLKMVDTIEKLQEWSKEPDSILQKLVEEDSPAGVKMALLRLRPVVEPVLEEMGLWWQDAEPALEKELSGWLGEWEEALEDPRGYLDACDLSDAKEAASNREAAARREQQMAAEQQNEDAEDGSESVFSNSASDVSLLASDDDSVEEEPTNKKDLDM